MDRFAAGAVVDLMATACAIGNNPGIRPCVANRRQQLSFAHRHRQFEHVDIVAEGTCHTATTALNQLGFQPRNSRKQTNGGREGIKGLLVTMPVKHQRLPGCWPKRKLHLAGFDVLLNELLKKQ
ncbi:MAG: hypothetical protein EBS75_03030 [Betaproteobacteria bacterium]|nr:hypothetical protein [Betaproteobacteria bacterium]